MTRMSLPLILQQKILKILTRYVVGVGVFAAVVGVVCFCCCCLVGDVWVLCNIVLVSFLGLVSVGVGVSIFFVRVHAGVGECC